jgi:hypothetical protein
MRPMAVESVHSVSPSQCRLLQRLLRFALRRGLAENGLRMCTRRTGPTPLESRLVELWQAVTAGMAGDYAESTPKTGVGFFRP